MRRITPTRVYIAGPMRGIEKFNFPAFDDARDLAISFGHDPISPADLDREHFSQSDWDEIKGGNISERMLRSIIWRDLYALTDLSPGTDDAIALLPGWEKSSGAVAEFFVARWLGLNVWDATTMTPFTTTPDVRVITHAVIDFIESEDD